MAHTYLDSLMLVCFAVAEGIIPDNEKTINETTREIANDENAFRHLYDLLGEREAAVD